MQKAEKKRRPYARSAPRSHTARSRSSRSRTRIDFRETRKPHSLSRTHNFTDIKHARHRAASDRRAFAPPHFATRLNAAYANRPGKRESTAAKLQQRAILLRVRAVILASRLPYSRAKSNSSQARKPRSRTHNRAFAESRLAGETENQIRPPLVLFRQTRIRPAAFRNAPERRPHKSPRQTRKQNRVRLPQKTTYPIAGRLTRQRLSG